ncbi:Oidioi.mRNA.OKI2018_I69.XSR.g14365.t1.cds [Oikopleura dioica]|uniref:Oidioi.mRNA.OKI2018_I69.XSR.g14365.t1.cds n=1 Tax=Oikopleura dioica TaxID=34765 RepID=A0ABN7S9M6_OIKDI|nr:Oidioi.mRNA.OKI2018_I69.XSR.g14365.t1.cds [Oikopleura dioica]
MYQSGDFSRLSTRVLSLENAQLEAREDNQEKLARVDDMMDGHRMMLNRFNGTLATLTMNKALLNGKLDDFSEGISKLVLALSETTDKQGALTEKVLRMENSFDAFTKSAKTHVHEYLHAKLKTLETKELVIQNEVRKLKELVADAEQELDRVKSLEIVFKENVDSSVRRLRQEFEGLKNARDIADFRLEQKVQDKMDELQKNLNDERGSETLLKIFANRTSILSDNIKTEIQDLQEELSRLESIFMERNDEIKQNTTALARTVQSSIVDAVRRENDVSSKMNSLRSDLDSLTLVATRQAGTYEERLNAAVLKINSLIDTLTQTTSEQSDRLAHTTSEIGQLSAKVEYLKSNTLDKTFWKYDDFETIYKQMKDLATFNVELKLAQLRSAMETKIVATQLALEQDTDEMDEKIDEITEKLSRTARLEEKIRAVQESNDLTSAQLKKMVHEKTEDLIQQQARLVTVVNSLRAKLADTEQDEFARLSSEIDRQARLTIDLNSKVESHNGQFKELEELISSLKSTRSDSVANNQIISQAF